MSDSKEKKATRGTRKAKRQAIRQQRKAHFQKLMQMAEHIHLPDNDEVIDSVAAFKTYWPFVKEGLEFAESLRVTGEKLDDRLNVVINKGDVLFNDPDLAQKIEALVTKGKDFWLKCRKVLLLATRFTPEKADEVIDKVIAIGDDFFQYEDQHSDDSEG